MSDKEKRETSSGKQRYSFEQLHKESGMNDKEEYAADMSAAYGGPLQAPVEVSGTNERSMENARGGTAANSRWLGYTALALAILSMFMLPAILGSGAMLIGAIAFGLGSRALGVWSVILGLISLAGYFLLVPLYS
ncbi:hypothetical protein ACFQ88_14470 [Paenibacillus sp. NPDC056579]|uniref:hypothetical protein n=1 Tax=Paenibacillus sp. NPDC056579 TaxID=3345871 RepID=UPI0036BB96A6